MKTLAAFILLAITLTGYCQTSQKKTLKFHVTCVHTNCDFQGIVSVAEACTRCHGGRAVPDGFIQEYTLEFTCPHCKETCSTSYESFVRKVPAVEIKEESPICNKRLLSPKYR